MIFTTIKDINRYLVLNPYFEKAVNYLLTNDFENCEDGKYELINENVFAIVSTLKDATANEVKLEAHKKYIDIHFIIRGTESFGIKPTHYCLFPIGSFDIDKDVLLYEDSEFETLLLTKGDCVIVFPEDAHAPTLQTKGLKKVILKIIDQTS